MNVELTLHAIQRGRERLNLSEHSLRRTAQKAFEVGMHSDLARGVLKGWCSDHLAAYPGSAIFILGHQAFVFQSQYLITVLLIPHAILPKPPKLRNRPEEDFEEEDLEEDELPPDIRKMA